MHTVHPTYTIAKVQCACGNQFETRSTKEKLHVEICNACHPFYTGVSRTAKSSDRTQRFYTRHQRNAR
jgi:large subunit ribosomal protein L31